LDLTNLAIEVSTIMPESILHMRLREASELSEALTILTELQPFEELDKRCNRLYNNRLQSTEITSINNKITEKKTRFTITSKTFSELLQLTPSATPKTKIIPLGKTVNDITYAATLKEIKKEIKTNQNAYTENAKKILDNSFDPAKNKRLTKLIPDAIAAISPTEVKQLKNITEIQEISQITLSEIDKTKTAIKEMITEAAELAQTLSEPLKAARIRLYAQVAK